MKKFLKSNIKTVVAFVIGIIITGGAVYAANLIASDVTYDNTTSGLQSTTVQGALDELNAKAQGIAPKMSDMCPGCKYIYTTTQFSYGSGATALNSTLQSQLKDNWEDVVTGSGKKWFLGVKVNSSTNVVEKAYTCGIKDGVPFCIEGSIYGPTYNANKALLNSASLYNNGCSDYGSGVTCSGSVYAGASSDGNVNVNGSDSDCRVSNDGRAYCEEF